MKRVKLTLVTTVVFALACAVSFSASSIDWSEAGEEGLAQFIYEVIESDQSELENASASEGMYSILYERSAIESLKDTEHHIANNDPSKVVSQEVNIDSQALNEVNESGAEIEVVSLTAAVAQDSPEAISSERESASTPELVASAAGFDGSIEVYTVHQILSQVISFQDDIQISQATVSTSSDGTLNSNITLAGNTQSGQADASRIETASTDISVPATDAKSGEWSAIPEPATALFGIVGIGALAIARRRMKSRE